MEKILWRYRGKGGGSLIQGPFSEGGVPMQCVKSVELVSLGRQEVQSFIFLPAGL